MKVFSRVVATFDGEFNVWLPPCDELSGFIEQLSGFEVEATEKNGELSICGTLEAVNSIEESLINFIQDKEEGASNDELMTGDILMDESMDDDLPSTPARASASEEGEDWSNDSSSSNPSRNSLSADGGEDEEEDDCLNIEVFHSEATEEADRKKFKFSCNLCSFKSQRESHFLRHVGLHQRATATIHRCDQCSFSTLRSTHLRQHQVVHSDRKLKCSACNYTSDDPRLLARHSRVRHKEILPAETPYAVQQCPSCPYQTTRSHLFQRHMKVHSAEESKGGPNLHICSQCDYRTTRKMHFLRHVRDVHRGSRPFLCHHCGKAFKRPDALKQHAIRHVTEEAVVDGKPLDAKLAAFQCRVCNKLCHSRAHLKEHQAVHSTERAFLCEICGASFKTRSVHRKHVANLHQNPRAFPCKLCTKRFNTNYALRRHMKQHPTDSATDSNALPAESAD